MKNQTASHTSGKVPAPAEKIHIVDMCYWRVPRVARQLDVRNKRVYQLVKEGRLAAIRLSPRSMRICRKSLERYIHEVRLKNEGY